MTLQPKIKGLAALTAIAVSLGATPAVFGARMTDNHAVRAAARKRSRPLLLAHYMPWYQAKPFSPTWGWHWTMNHFNPDHVVNGRRDAASQYYPLIGAYDSGDPDALQCQVLLMKMAGIDGVIIDWYGNDEYMDYGVNNRNTERLIPILEKAGLRFAICYEDQTIPKEIEGKVFPASDAVGHGQRLMQWMQARFFSSPAYVKIGKRPLFLTFGAPYYDDAQWNQVFSVLPQKPLYITENDRREPTASSGGFDWPAPGGGSAGAARERDAFYGRAKRWPLFVAAAYPRFNDIYQQAGVGRSWGSIDDNKGRTYTDTLTKALQSGAPVVQLVTWNDWGEGTQIEPSVEIGYRDLEATQQLRRKLVDPSFDRKAADLRLPVDWYLVTKKKANDPAARVKLKTFFPLMVSGHIAGARALLDRYRK